MYIVIIHYHLRLYFLFGVTHQFHLFFFKVGRATNGRHAELQSRIFRLLVANVGRGCCLGCRTENSCAI